MLAVLLITSIAPDLAKAAQRIMLDFGYPKFEAIGTTTSSGGMEFESAPFTLRVDAQGRPRNLKIKSVRFELSDAKKARAKIRHLLSRYPLRLPAGQWMTERAKAPDLPYGMASSSFRYYFVPIVKGYPYLAGGQMTVQFSSDLKKVLEWAYHPWEVRTGNLPPKVLSKSQALKVFESWAAASISGKPDMSYSITKAHLRLGWIHIGKPKLAYAVPYTFYRRSSFGTRGGGSIALIDAGSGAPLAWRE